MRNENCLELVKQMRQGTVRLAREGEYWTPEEREDLVQMYKDSVGITEMALRLQRREDAINQQLKILGLYELAENAPRRQRTEKKAVCLCGKCKKHDDCPFYQLFLCMEEDD